MSTISFVFDCIRVDSYNHSASFSNPVCGSFLVDTRSYERPFIVGMKYVFGFEDTYCIALTESKGGFTDVEC